MAVQPGDRFVCYLKGKLAWVGALEATGKSYLSSEPIFNTDGFPVRVPVRPLLALDVSTPMPMALLEGRISWFPVGAVPALFSAHLHGSPRRYKPEDGEAIYRGLLSYDDGVRVLPHPARTVTAPIETVVADPATAFDPQHSEIQQLLGRWGTATGCRVWIPRNDRVKLARLNGGLSGIDVVDKVPLMGDARAQSIVENIDVLWLEKQTIVSAFEVEHSTSIYSGLLRMADLVALHRYANIDLFIVAPESRRPAVAGQLTRPTFEALRPPLAEVCGFLPYEELVTRFEQLQPLLKSFRPEGIRQFAAFFKGDNS